MLVLGGCGATAPRPATGPVALSPLPPATHDVVGRCSTLLAALPATLGPDRTLPRRPTTGGAGRTAAWGDPAVTLACGTAPADPTAEQVQLGPSSGGIVTFAILDLGPATAFTTVGLAVPVTVTVPDAYDSTLLVPITVPLLATDR